MTSRSSTLRRLEHQFFECFLVSVASPTDRTLDLDELDGRFLGAWTALSAGEATGSDDFVDFLQRVRPDPVTGVSPALRRNVQRLQPGRVSMPNPGYRHGDVLPGIRHPVQEFGPALDPRFDELFASAVAAFKA